VDRPNVILVLTDDQGYGDFSCHGNSVLRTPNLDRLHGQSIRLTDFHVAPMCTPTRGELMSGLDALRNKARHVCGGLTMLRTDVPTMGDVFRADGYRTGLFGKWHLGDSYPYLPQNRGFQEVVHHRSWGVTSAADHGGNDYFDDTYLHNGRPQKYEGYCNDVWFREAAKWNENYAEAYFRLGETCQKLKDAAGARVAYEKFLKLEPDTKRAAQVRKLLTGKL